MKRSPIIRKTPLRSKKPFRPNIAAGDTLMGVFGLKRVSAKPREVKQRARLPRLRKGRLANIERECEILWAAYIKLRYGNKSVLSGAQGPLDAAHVWPRTRLTTKFHPLNGIPLTRAEATNFTEHPADFYNWVRRWWPHTELTLDALEQLSNTFTHPTEDWFLARRDELRAALRAHHDTDVGHTHD